mgnify:CR=1 FL=1
MNNVEKELTAFGKHWRTEARKSLTRQGKKSTGSLYKSLDWDLRVHRQSSSLDLLMEDYGEFVDQGVQGTKDNRKAPNSDYKFGTGNGKKGGLTKAIDKWVKRHNIQFRNKKGQFITKKATAFIIRRSIWNTGLKTTLFSSRPFELAFKRLPDDIVNAYALDIDNFLKFTK